MHQLRLHDTWYVLALLCIEPQSSPPFSPTFSGIADDVDVFWLPVVLILIVKCWDWERAPLKEFPRFPKPFYQIIFRRSITESPNQSFSNQPN